SLWADNRACGAGAVAGIGNRSGEWTLEIIVRVSSVIEKIVTPRADDSAFDLRVIRVAGVGMSDYDAMSGTSRRIGKEFCPRLARVNRFDAPLRMKTFGKMRFVIRSIRLACPRLIVGDGRREQRLGMFDAW